MITKRRRNMEYSKEVKKTVNDILELYTDLYSALNDDELEQFLNKNGIFFYGFDADSKSEEYEYYGQLYDQYKLIKDGNEFEVIKEMFEKGHGQLESHNMGPGLKKYKLMIKKWREIIESEEYNGIRLEDAKELLSVTLNVSNS